MKKLLIFIALLLSISLAGNADIYMGSRPLGQGYDAPEASEGPTGSIMVTSPGVGNAGNMSLGSGFTYVKLDNSSTKSSKFYQSPISFSYTPIDKLDLSITLPFIKMTNKSTSCGDLYSSIKYGHSLFENLDIKSAISVGFNFPTGGENYSGTDNATDISFDFPMQKEYEIYTINLNFGFGFTDIGKSSKDDEYYKIAGAVSRALGKKVGISFDIIYQDSSSSSNLIIGAGLKYLHSNKTSFTFAFGADSISTGLDYLVSAGISQSF